MKETDRKFQETAQQMKETDRKFQETAQQMKETDRKFQETAQQQKETDRLMKESSEKFDREMKERREEFNRDMKERDEKFERRVQTLYGEMGHLKNRFGKMVEHLVAPNIEEKFNELGFEFGKHSPNVKFTRPGSKELLAEIDILLANGNVVIAVEVKAKVTHKEVEEYVGKMQVLRDYADSHNDKRRYHGAIAVAIIDESIRKYILKHGFYVIEQTGDTVRINVPKSFKPREW